jgi:four helix bundle protein
MAKITSYRDLQCWQQAMDLAEIVYRITRTYPRDERFGLTSHTRRTAVAVPSNIAEGTRRKTPGYIARLIDALAEHAELETQMMLAERFHYLAAPDMKAFMDLSASVGRLTHGLLRSLDPLA